MHFDKKRIAHRLGIPFYGREMHPGFVCAQVVCFHIFICPFQLVLFIRVYKSSFIENLRYLFSNGNEFGGKINFLPRIFPICLSITSLQICTERKQFFKCTIVNFQHQTATPREEAIPIRDAETETWAETHNEIP